VGEFKLTYNVVDSISEATGISESLVKAILKEEARPLST
jgi:hypothetical protein